MEQSNEIKKLKENLFCQRKHGGNVLSSDEISECYDFAEGYKDYLNKAKTERENVSFVLKMAIENGFTEFDKNKKYVPGDKVYCINRNCNIALAVIGKQGSKNGVKLSIAHIDAPRLDLKPNPLFERNDVAMFKTHYYGGIKKYQWTAIPLALHGRIVKKDGSFVDVCIGENDDDPKFCITDLLPHLAREQMSKKMSEAISGEDLNVTIGSIPFKSDEGSELVKLNILKLLNEKYGIVEEDFISSDLELVPAMKSSDIGFDRSLIGGYAHDDRSCAYPSFKAIFDCKEPEKTVVVLLADKEEIGSTGNTGTKSNFLKYFISDLANIDGVKGRDVLSKSKCLSADVNAAYDSTFANNFESMNSSFINKGVVVEKYTGHGGKYDTSEASAEFTGEIRKLLNENNILWQSGELGKVDTGGGGTIAMFIANLNVDVIDIGVPVLSMHAPFEVISKIDLFMTYKAILAFLNA